MTSKTHNIVVADASPIIALGGIERLDLLRELYGTITIPKAVFSEITARRDFAARQLIESSDWITISEPNRILDVSQISKRLHQGEIEAISLALEMENSLLIVDDLLARKEAMKQGLQITGTVGVLLRAERQGLVNNLSDILNQIQKNGLYIPENIIKELVKSK